MSDSQDDSDNPTTYRDAGVDRRAAREATSGYDEAVESTRIPGVLEAGGGFAALFDLGEAEGLEDIADPLLVSATDGVGTKLKVASEMGRHDTIGIDCVGMCVNDVRTTGARPLFFLDYLSTDTLDPEQAREIVGGVAAGCRAAGCALVGGETAEMPDVYRAGGYDIAGFCVGVVDADRVIRPEAVRPGDRILGIASGGIHSNGFSLIRKILDDRGWSWKDPRPELEDPRPIGEVLLEPTRLYGEAVEHLQAEFDLHGLAHITGGGLPGNLPRALPDRLAPLIDRKSWEVPPIFELLCDAGEVPEDERYRVFNMGIGFAAILPADQIESARSSLADAGWTSHIIGEVQAR